MNTLYKIIPITILSLSLLMMLDASAYAQSDRPLNNTDSMVWQQIDITSPNVKEKKKRLPWYIPTIGAAALATGSYLVLTAGSDEPDPDLPFPIANNLDITIECGEGGEINPLVNDEGEDIKLVNFSAPAGLVSRAGDELIISTDAINDFTINYTIENIHGNQATAIITVLVSSFQATVEDIQIEGERGTELTFNLFDHFQCERCNLLFVEQNDNVSNLSHSINGLISMMINQNASESFQLVYTIRDKCQNRLSAVIEIVLVNQPCEIIGDLNTIDPLCGLDNGQIEFDTDSDSYEYLLNGISVDKIISNLAAGQYELQIIDTTKAECEESIQIELNDKPANYLEPIAIHPFNCYQEGDVELTWIEENTSSGVVMTLSLTDNTNNFSVEVNPGDNLALAELFPDAILEGNIIIEVNSTDFMSEECTQTLELNIEEEEVIIEPKDDVFTIAAGNLLSSNVLDNDEGIGISVSTFSPISDVPLFTIEESGQLMFMSDQFVEANYMSMYTITDTCGQTAQATVTIQTIIDADCRISPILEVFPADCGLSNGSARITLDFPGLDTPQWQLPDGWIAEGQGVFILDDLPSGSIEVLISETITGCDTILFDQIEELPSEYILQLNSDPADCRPNGEINIVLQDLYDDYNLELLDEDQMLIGSWEVSSGSTNLSDLTEISAGQYTINVTALDLPDRCSESQTIVVLEELPEIMANDLNATIQQGTIWTGNVINNDTGEELMVSDFTPPEDGQLTLMPNGDAEYTPAPGFTGLITFDYIVTDICDQTDTATVTIEVIEVVDCIFELNISVSDATCSLSDGLVSLTIEDGHCTDPQECFNWDDGSTGETNLLPAGDYQLSVTSSLLGCTEVFSFSVGSSIPNMVESIEPINKSCFSNGGVIFQLVDNSSDYNQAEIIIMSGAETVLDTLVNWSTFNTTDYLDLEAGEYIAMISPDIEDNQCDTSLTFTIELEEFELEAVDVFDTIAFNTNWSGNVLDNDIGTGLTVVSISDPLQGQASVDENGEGIYEPSNDFFGTISFKYSVQDTCGERDTAMVFITVLEPECDFIVNIDTSPASCNDGGDAFLTFELPDQGVVLIQLTTPSGDIISFNHSSAFLQLSNVIIVQPGNYSINVSDPEVGTICSENASFSIMEHVQPTLQLLNAVPPDSPDNNNGFITLLLGGSLPPFIVNVNGVQYGPFFNGSVVIPQLGEGLYSIYTQDAVMCLSDTIIVPLFLDGLGNQHQGLQFFNNHQSAQTQIYNNQLAASLREQVYNQNITYSASDIIPVQQIIIGGFVPITRHINTGLSLGYHSFLIANPIQTANNISYHYSAMNTGIHFIPKLNLGNISINLGMGYYFDWSLNNQNFSAFQAQNHTQSMNFLQFNPMINFPINSRITIQNGFDLQLLLNNKRPGSVFNAIPISGISYRLVND